MDRKALEDLIKEDPGNPAFVEVAEYFRQKKDFTRALEVCLSGLSVAPANHKGRLVLARTFYENGMLPFASRELEQLARELPNNEPIRKLIAILDPEFGELQADTQSQESEGDLVAESELDIDLLEDLEEEEDSH